MYIRKRLSALLLSWVLAFTLSAPAFAAVGDTDFSDVDAGAWYAEAVMYCREHNLMAGTGNNQFAPEDSLTRAQLATVLYRIEGAPTVTEPDAFTDTAEETWYSDAMAWASQQNIMTGYGGGLFGPNDPVSREQMTTTLWRYAGSPAAVNATNYSDETAIASYATAAVDWASANSIVRAVSDGVFSPKAHATRAQVADALMNYDRATQSVSSVENRILVAYFSRRGENWQVGNIEKGNTEIIAEMIAEQTGGDLFYIQTATPYPEDYMETVQQANAERTAGARPTLADDVENWDDYDTIFLG